MDRLESELDFLRLLDRRFPRTSGQVVLGRGDDCAILDLAGPLAVSSDAFVEEVHFRRSYFEPEDIGRKALAVNLSDLAAMAAQPVAFTLILGVPGEPDFAFFDRMFAGMAELAEGHGVVLAGGDLTRGPALSLGITVLGRPGPTGRLLRRGGMRPGDLVFAVGDLGLARTGLMAMEAEGRAARGLFPASCAAHLRPRPLTAEALALADIPEVRGLMDLSDGLAADLPRFLGQDAGSGLGLDAALPTDGLHPEVLSFCRGRGCDPVDHAFAGGEDYGLLGGVAPGGWDAVRRTLPGCRLLGTVDETARIALNKRSTRDQGFDHFRPHP